MVNTLGTKRHEFLVNCLVSRRVEAGLTQMELARRLGQYQSFVARLESGQRRVDVVEFLQLSEVLQFDPIEILSAVQSMKA